MKRHASGDFHAALSPSDLERQKIFYWLKRVSSVTAWRRILRYYKAWAAATENSLLVAERNGWAGDTSLPQAEYALLLECLANCEKGVARLAKGDKSVFCFRQYGEFSEAARILAHWTQMLQRLTQGENSIKMLTPLWDEFCEALISLAQAWGECGQLLFRTQASDRSAQLPYNEVVRQELAAMWVPADLARIPDPLENRFVWSGLYVPCSGIWEPIVAPEPTLLDVIFRSPKPVRPYRIAGAMNYLAEGATAPELSVQTAGDSIRIDTTWRLLWEDDRYRDGTIPEEEAHYRFSMPSAIRPPPPAKAPFESAIQAESGATVPYSGQWLVASRPETTTRFRKGDILPLHGGCVVRWVFANNQC